MLAPGGRSNEDAILQSSWHGKSCVRVAKVKRGSENHIFTEYNVEISLVGGSQASFIKGDNSQVVATDTCKNHVYLLAKSHEFNVPESFALDLAERFLNLYPWLEESCISVVERPWRRMTIDDRLHSHGFALAADGTRFTRLTLVRGKNGSANVAELISGLKSLSVLKTTQSGWANFFRDNYTTLPETAERILATTISGEWTYTSRTSERLRALLFSEIHEKLRNALLREFYGPPGKGHFSPGVQNTLFLMAKAAKSAVPDIATITLSLPNLHFLPCTIPVYAQNDIKFEDDVFIPTDEPHGIISATIGGASRRMAKM